MQSQAIYCRVILALLTPGMCFGQSKEHNPLLARLSYHNALVEDLGEQSPRICFAVYENGFYFLLRSEPVTILYPGSPEDGQPIDQGRLTAEQLNRLKIVLRDIGFKSKDEGIGGVVREDSEWFVAEVAQQGKSVHYTWGDADHLSPFPSSVARLVDWLQNFKAQNSIRLMLHELSDISICPSMNENPLPVIAGLNQQSSGITCRQGP